MKKISVWLFVAAAGFCAGTHASGETVHLKDGTVLKGEILQTTAGMVKVKTSLGVFELEKGKIKSIEYTEEEKGGGATLPETLPEEPGPVDPAPLIHVDRDGKHGFINQEGRLVIPFQYDDAMFFREGLAAVRIGWKWGYIDRTGKIVIKPQYDDTICFWEGRALVEVGGKAGYINRRGTMVIEPQFTGGPMGAKDFREGLAVVDVGPYWGYIDRTGKIAIKPQFHLALPFNNGLAAVKKEKNGKWGLIDRSGALVKAYEGDSPIELLGDGPFTERVGGKVGYVDKKLKSVIPPQFHKACIFSEGMACAMKEKDGKYGYIDKTGAFVIDPQFDEAENFKEGFALVKTGKDWGFIGKDGKWAFGKTFSGAISFFDGGAWVYPWEGKSLLINRKGERIWPPIN